MFVRNLSNRGRYLEVPSYLHTPWFRVLLEKLTGLQLVKKFPTFHETQRFITTPTSVCHLSLSWTSPIKSTYPHPNSWRSILIFHPSMPRCAQWCLSLQFTHQDPIHLLSIAHACHMPSSSHSSRFYHPQNIGLEYRSFSSSLCWSSIYTLILESVHSCVLCVRNPSNSRMAWRCINTLILEGDHLLVVFCRNYFKQFGP